MNTPPRILRLALLIPVAFISLAGVVVATVITYRSWQFEKATREAQKHAIESHVLIEQAKIAEEVYLGLDNWNAREKQIATYFQGNGTRTKLRFERISGVDRKESQDIMRWKAVDEDFGTEQLRVPLYFSDLFVGIMFVDVSWGRTWSIDGFVDLSAAVLAPVLLIIFLWLVTFLLLRKKVIGPFLEQMVRLNRLEAISETTQMIAHDVRKPFHMMRLSLQALKKSAGNSPDDRLRRLTDELTPTIEKASAEVDDMLRDIVDLERPQGLRAAETSLADMIAAIVTDHKTHRDDQEVTVRVELRHTHLAMIDRFKIQRVLSNLLQNGFHAVERKGKIWITTIQQPSHKSDEIVICIGNSGSVIAKADVARLFDRFFSKGKQNGTGLGLAIAKKFVNAHGGRIWCESSASEGTQFFFSVPTGTAVEETEKAKIYMASPSDEGELDLVTDQRSGGGSHHPAGSFAMPCRQAASVALISDDAFFRDGMKILLETIPDHSMFKIDIIGSYTVAEATAMKEVLSQSRLIIVDFENECELTSIAGMLQHLSRTVLVSIHARGQIGSLSDRLGPNCVHLAKPVILSQVESLLKSPRSSR